MIPRRLVRTVPEVTDPQVEMWWAKACELHPDWEHVTYRDPIDPAGFPLTHHAWSRCTSGAQRAGLIRLEAIWHGGGVYIDSDVELYRPLEPLRGVHMFAGWEDPGVVPDAVFGAEPEHPAVGALIEEALRRLHSRSSDWRTGNGAWSTGPGAFTTLLPGRDDVLLLPPGSFYPYHYTEKHRAREDHAAIPWCFGAHHWAGSWL